MRCGCGEDGVVTMAETPKKIIDSEYKCFLCDAFTHSSRVKIFGLDIPRLIESAVGENLGKYENSGSQMFPSLRVNVRLRLTLF